ncbi:MAG: hypothetical protein WCP28_15330, partial [Actinomycetes bacterium]
FKVAAVNAVGTSTFSPASEPVIPVAPVAPVAASVAQHVSGLVPKATAAKANKKLRLPARTDAGQTIQWITSNPKICKVRNGKLVMTGRKGTCKITAVVASNGTYAALSTQYAIRFK